MLKYYRYRLKASTDCISCTTNAAFIVMQRKLEALNLKSGVYENSDICDNPDIDGKINYKA